MWPVNWSITFWKAYLLFFCIEESANFLSINSTIDQFKSRRIQFRPFTFDEFKRLLSGGSGDGGAVGVVAFKDGQTPAISCLELGSLKNKLWLVEKKSRLLRFCCR